MAPPLINLLLPALLPVLLAGGCSGPGAEDYAMLLANMRGWRKNIICVLNSIRTRPKFWSGKVTR